MRHRGMLLDAMTFVVLLTGAWCLAQDTQKAEDAAGQPKLVPLPTEKVTVPPPPPPPAKELILDIGNGVSMKLVLIPAGKFLMGSPKDEKGRPPVGNEGLAPGKWENGNPQLEVTISKPFYLGVYVVTVDQYAQFVKDTGQPHDEPRFKQTGEHPVVNVSWDDAVAFCEWLSKRTGRSVRLPTEAQWEYACRAGTKTRFSFGDDASKLGEYAWFWDNNGSTSQPIIKTHPVGQKKPNAWGLFDMHGNVLEWCRNWYTPFYDAADTMDPTGPALGNGRVLRGHWNTLRADWCRSASRLSGKPDPGFDWQGFRVSVDGKWVYGIHVDGL